MASNLPDDNDTSIEALEGMFQKPPPSASEDLGNLASNLSTFRSNQSDFTRVLKAIADASRDGELCRPSLTLKPLEPLKIHVSSIVSIAILVLNSLDFPVYLILLHVKIEYLSPIHQNF